MKGIWRATAGAGKTGKRQQSPTEEPFRKQAAKLFRSRVMQSGFPCVGAKAAFNSGAVSFQAYEQLGSEASTDALGRDLCHFTYTIVADRGSEYATMIAVFRGPLDLTELEFEKLLWLQLNKLHRKDSAHEWDPRVSSDPNAPNFSFSFAGQAYYVIGIHANSSRQARRFRWPTLVFNPHEQFERLRADGNWERMKETIRARELQLQGSINSMLSDFGEESEARQYSGRAVEKNWRPPFSPIEIQPADSREGKCPFKH